MSVYPILILVEECCLLHCALKTSEMHVEIFERRDSSTCWILPVFSFGSKYIIPYFYVTDVKL